MTDCGVQPRSFVEKSLVMQENSAGLMTRANRLARILRGDKCFASVKNGEWKGIRSKLNKGFPELAEISRDPKFESFQKSASSVMSELRYAYELFWDLAKHTFMHLDLLKSMLAQIASYKFDECREPVNSFMQCFTAYCRLFFLVSRIEERKTVSCLFAAAHQCAKGSPEPRFSKLAKGSLQFFDEPGKILVDQFSKYSNQIAQVVTYCAPTVQLGTTGATELLRRNALSIIEDNLALGSPAAVPLDRRDASKSGRTLHMELLQVRQVCDFVVLATLACPTLLTNGMAMATSKLVCCDNLVLALFRGTSLNIHAELEALAKWYPPRHLAKSWPREIKLAKLFKDWSKEAALKSGLAHRERRGYLLSEISILDGLIAACPSLCAPKAPVILAAVSLAFDELRWILRHSPSKGDALPPKNRLKHYVADQYIENKLAMLAGSACKLASRFARERQTVAEYYAHYLTGCDAKALESLGAAAAPRVPSNTDDLRLVPDLMRSLGTNVLANGNITPESCLKAYDKVLRDGIWTGGDYAPAAIAESPTATARLDWKRISAVLCASPHAKNMLKDDNILKFLKRGHTTFMDRSRLADGSLFIEHCDPGSLWPFRTQLLKALDEAFTGKPAAWPAAALCAIVAVARDAPRSLTHPSAPEDGNELSIEAKKLGEYAVTSNLKDAVLASLKKLANNCSRLSEMIAPVQAAYRLERKELAAAEAEKRGGRRASAAAAAAGEEMLAGEESFPANGKLVEPIAQAETRLAKLLVAARDELDAGIFTPKDQKGVVVSELRLRPLEFAKSAVLTFLQQQVPACFLDGSGKLLHRPTQIERSLDSVMAAAERAASYVEVDYCGYVASVLLDPDRTPPLNPISEKKDASPQNPEKIKNVHAPIADSTAAFYVKLIRNLPPGVIFCASRGGFVRLGPAPTPEKGQSSSASVEVDKYLSASEITALARVLGADALRCLDENLNRAAVDEMAQVKRAACVPKDSKSARKQKLDKIRVGFLNGEWLQPALELKQEGVLDHLLRHATRLGNILELKALLRDAGARASERAAPHLARSARLALDSSTRNDDSTLARAPDWLLAPADATFIGQRDPSFAEDVIDNSYSRDDGLYHEAKPLLEAPDEFKYFPYAMAAALVADHWKGVKWLPDFNALDGTGLHVTSAAVRAIAFCFNGLPPEHPRAPTQAKALVARFVEAAAAIVTWIRLHVDSKDLGTGSDIPVRAVCAYLELVAQQAAIPRSTIEQYLPYAVIHSSLMDIAMGRHTADDEKKTPFTAAAFDVFSGATEA